MVSNSGNTLQRIKEVFFEAMMDGYAGGLKRSAKYVSHDGYKTIEFFSGIHGVVDRYCVTPHSDFSAGTTTIFCLNAPVWWMTYSGCYLPSVIPFLKKALRQAYEKSDFFGGRGPRFFSDGELTYSNFVEQSSTFERFSGEEQIINQHTGVLLGWHKYSGISFL